MNDPNFELEESVRAVLLSDLLAPEHLFDLLSQIKQNWHGQLKEEQVAHLKSLDIEGLNI